MLVMTIETVVEPGYKGSHNQHCNATIVKPIMIRIKMIKQ